LNQSTIIFITLQKIMKQRMQKTLLIKNAVILFMPYGIITAYFLARGTFPTGIENGFQI